MLSKTREQSKRVHGNEPARGMRKRLQTRKPVLTFVTSRALFGIEFVRGYAEHIIALDADAVQNGRFGRRSGSLFLFRPRAFGSIHDGGILSRGACRPSNRGEQHPETRAGHLIDRLMRVEKMANLLIDFRLSIRSTIQASARNPERQAPAKAG